MRGIEIGAALRRTPWPLLPLLVPAIAGLFAFGSSPVSAHDGWGDRTWTPVASGGISTDYRTAFGRATASRASRSSMIAFSCVDWYGDRDRSRVGRSSP